MSELIPRGYHLADTIGVRVVHAAVGVVWLTAASLGTWATLVAIAAVAPLLGDPQTVRISETWPLVLSITVSMTVAIGASMRAWRRFGAAAARLDAVHAHVPSGSIGR